MPTNNHGKSKENPTMSHRFFTACLLILGGIVALWIAVDLLTKFWVWLVLIGLLALAGWIVFRVLQARRNRW